MNYSFKEFSIGQLFELLEKSQIDLNPSYQRNFIWSPDDQKQLIDTILKGYPLPSFFIYLHPNSKYEMVDGQQRTKTIYRFIKGQITTSKEFNKISFANLNDQSKFLEYKIPVVVLSNLLKGDSLNEFYVLINKKGVHLNIAEVNKSEFINTNFLRLASDLLTYQNLINLNLFSEATSKRMNDRAFVEELLGYLNDGIKDKKKSVESLFSSDITAEEYNSLETMFKQVIDKIENFNRIHQIAETRYKQKNDFYTLFSFIRENLDEDENTLQYQYRVLLVLDRIDSEGRQYIRPSNDDCQALKEYATNCITQSNSKTAREKRLNFFNAVLKNTNYKNNETLLDILKYLSSIYGEDKLKFKRVGKYELLNLEEL